MVQRYTKILESYNIALPFSAIATFMFCEQELVVYCHRDADPIKLKFSSVVAYRSHDDFHHPDCWSEHNSESPTTNDTKYLYPALEVINSVWISSFPGHQDRFGSNPAKHYKFISYNNVVDIITLKDFDEMLVTANELDKIKNIVRNS